MEYEIYVLQADSLNMKVLSLRKRCYTFWRKLKDVEKEEAKYKEMCKSGETYVNKEVALLTNIRRVSKDLEQDKLNH